MVYLFSRNHAGSIVKHYTPLLQSSGFIRKSKYKMEPKFLESTSVHEYSMDELDELANRQGAREKKESYL